MTDLGNSTPATRLDPFHVYKATYKKVGSHEIQAAILIPKEQKPGKHPLLVKIHGGLFITGDALYTEWLAAWYAPLIYRTNAIAVLPNYRLMPDVSGADILDDLKDLWTWIYSGGLDTYLRSQNLSMEIDYEHILAAGDSAGGHLALMSGLTQPKGSIKAVIVESPMTDTFTGSAPPEALAVMPPIPPTLLDDHLKNMTPDSIVSGAIPPERLFLSFAIGAAGRFDEFFGADKKMWPIYRIEDAEKGTVPPIWIMHSEDDTIVAVKDVRTFVEKAKKVEGTEVRLDVRPGQHGFDLELREDEEEWLKEGLAWAQERWLA